MNHNTILAHPVADESPFEVDGVLCVRLKLTQGRFTTIWAEDYELLREFAALICLRGYVYVRRCGQRSMTSIGRFLLGLDRGDRRVADHINGDTLDNRRCNLRVATHSQNTINSPVFKNNKLGLKGVHKDKNALCPKYVAQGRYRGKITFIGHFYTPEAAHFMYCWFARQHYDGFSREGSLKFEEDSASVDFNEENGETKIEIRFRAGDDVSKDVPKIVAAMARLTLKCPRDQATTTA